MTEIARIVNHLREAYAGAPWHGPSLKSLLSDVDFERAADRRLQTVHTIWELVLHVTSWEGAAIEVLRGKPAPSLPWAKDWPKAGTTFMEWNIARQALDSTHDELLSLVSCLSEKRLDDPVPGRTYSLHWLLYGLASHTAYHGGQIAILKKV